MNIFASSRFTSPLPVCGFGICPRKRAAFCACIITNSMKRCDSSPKDWVLVWTSAMGVKLIDHEQEHEHDYDFFPIVLVLVLMIVLDLLSLWSADARRRGRKVDSKNISRQPGERRRE